jgi:hypothetical protein
MQYLQFFAIVVVGLGVILHSIHCFSAIPSLVIPNLALQEVPPPIQDESVDMNE